MLAAVTGEPMSEKFGIILGSNDRVEFRIEDFIHFYHCIKTSFMAMQYEFTGKMADRPEPMPRAEHGRWSSLAEKFFSEIDRCSGRRDQRRTNQEAQSSRDWHGR